MHVVRGAYSMRTCSPVLYVWLLFGPKVTSYRRVTISLACLRHVCVPLRPACVSPGRDSVARGGCVGKRRRMQRCR